MIINQPLVDIDEESLTKEDEEDYMEKLRKDSAFMREVFDQD